jgi:hypothetical protein
MRPNHPATAAQALRVARAFERLNLSARARLLGRLLGALGPLALAVIGGGVFAKYLHQAREAEIPVSLDDAARATAAQVYELVRYIEQSNPGLLDRLLATFTHNGMTLAALGASVMAIAYNRVAERER